jgi:hypothetical protein
MDTPEMDDMAYTRAVSRKTHRGRRSRGKGPKPDGIDYHAEAKTHAASASSAKSPDESRAHLMRALSSLKKC